MWYWPLGARGGVALPLGLMVRDVWRVRRGGSFLPVLGGRRTLDGGGGSRGVGNGMGNGMGTTTASSSSSHDCKTFFRALSIAALDILSRSLRCRSFVCAASLLLLLQFVLVSLWWGAVSTVLSVRVFDEDGAMTMVMHATWLALAVVNGKWATGTVASMLGFVAAGGVASWFGAQTALMERMETEAAVEEEANGQRQQ